MSVQGRIGIHDAWAPHGAAGTDVVETLPQRQFSPRRRDPCRPPRDADRRPGPDELCRWESGHRGAGSREYSEPHPDEWRGELRARSRAAELASRSLLDCGAAGRARPSKQLGAPSTAAKVACQDPRSRGVHRVWDGHVPGGSVS